MKEADKTATSERKRRGDEQSYERLKSVADHWVLEAIPAPPRPADPVVLVPAVDKAVRIMALVNGSENGMSLAEIAKETGMTKSHCHGILKTLCHHDWLSFDDTSKRYRLHIGLMRDLSTALKDEISIVHIRPILERLSEAIGSSCVLSKPLPDGTFLVVDKVSAGQNVEISFPMGYRLPADATAHMRANLAWRSEFEIDGWFRRHKLKRYTSHTITRPPEAWAEVHATRRRGYARSNGEFTDGLMAIAMPVFDSSGQVTFIFDCVGTVPVMQEKETRIAREMTAAVDELHRLFGSRLPPDFPRSALVAARS